MEVQASTALLLGKEPEVPIGQKPEWVPGPIWTLERETVFFRLPGITPAVQPVANRYMFWAVPACDLSLYAYEDVSQFKSKKWSCLVLTCMLHSIKARLRREGKAELSRWRWVVSFALRQLSDGTDRMTVWVGSRKGLDKVGKGNLSPLVQSALSYFLTDLSRHMFLRSSKKYKSFMECLYERGTDRKTEIIEWEA
jgi:hypothetical protein